MEFRDEYTSNNFFCFSFCIPSILQLINWNIRFSLREWSYRYFIEEDFELSILEMVNRDASVVDGIMVWWDDWDTWICTLSSLFLKRDPTMLGRSRGWNQGYRTGQISASLLLYRSCSPLLPRLRVSILSHLVFRIEKTYMDPPGPDSRKFTHIQDRDALSCCALVGYLLSRSCCCRQSVCRLGNL